MIRGGFEGIKKRRDHSRRFSIRLSLHIWMTLVRPFPQPRSFRARPAASVAPQRAAKRQKHTGLGLVCFKARFSGLTAVCHRNADKKEHQRRHCRADQHPGPPGVRHHRRERDAPPHQDLSQIIRVAGMLPDALPDQTACTFPRKRCICRSATPCSPAPKRETHRQAANDRRRYSRRVPASLSRV